jgi:multidrug efflux pump subunit AcrB
MEREIAIPLEQALRSIEGVELRTTSTDGAATVAVEGAEDPIDAVRAEVAALLDEVVLPEDAEPLISRSTARFPPLWLVVRGEPRVASAAAESAAYRIEAGPAMLAQPCGETEVELEVALDPDRMAARAVTVAHIERALAAGLTSIPAGFVQAHGHELSIRSAGIANGDELAGVVIQAHAGMYVRIGDVAEVRERFAEPRCTAWRDGPVVAIAVRRWGLDEGSEQSIAEALEWSSAPIERFGEGARIEQGRILHAAGASRSE